MKKTRSEVMLLNIELFEDLKKYCTNCENIFKIEMFGKKKSNANGLYHHCKECVKIKNRNYAKN